MRGVDGSRSNTPPRTLAYSHYSSVEEMMCLFFCLFCGCLKQESEADAKKKNFDYKFVSGDLAWNLLQVVGTRSATLRSLIYGYTIHLACKQIWRYYWDWTDNVL